MNDWPRTTDNILDLLRTEPIATPFFQRLAELGLSEKLQAKIQAAAAGLPENNGFDPGLSRLDERELGTEMLLCRHRFTELVFDCSDFRQAVLSVIQNIYLFRHRRIFFGSPSESTEAERQQALLLFSDWREGDSLPLVRTFQHFIIARVWNRILNRSTDQSRRNRSFRELHQVVVRLNTLRNAYMILSAGLVRSLVHRISAIYRQTVSYDDAIQIGSFGIARAAYRYHPNSGVRFSTFAANWVRKEIQRQALEGRLVRISSHTVERYATAARTGSDRERQEIAALLRTATPDFVGLAEAAAEQEAAGPQAESPAREVEKRELKELLHRSIDGLLSARSADIIRRRYGLPPYLDEQPVIEIGRTYNITRSGIYQLERTALKKLRQELSGHRLFCR